MEYPNLLLVIRAARRPQYEVARAAGIREGRLSEIVRRGGATAAERGALSQVLGVTERRLFGARPEGIDQGDTATTGREE